MKPLRVTLVPSATKVGSGVRKSLEAFSHILQRSGAYNDVPASDLRDQKVVCVSGQRQGGCLWK